MGLSGVPSSSLSIYFARTFATCFVFGSVNLLVASTGMPKTSTFLSIEGEGESEMYSISNAVQNVGSGGEGSGWGEEG